MCPDENQCTPTVVSYNNEKLKQPQYVGDEATKQITQSSDIFIFSTQTGEMFKTELQLAVNWSH